MVHTASSSSRARDAPDFSSVSHILSPIGRVEYLGHDIGAAARFDLAPLASMYGMFAGSMAGMALPKRGPGAPKIGSVVKEQIVPYLSLLAEPWDGERWSDNMGNPMGMQLQGMRNIAEACRDEWVDGAVLEQLTKQMEKVVQRFGGDSGLTGLGHLLLEE